MHDPLKVFKEKLCYYYSNNSILKQMIISWYLVGGKFFNVSYNLKRLSSACMSQDSEFGPALFNSFNLLHKSLELSPIKYRDAM